MHVVFLKPGVRRTWLKAEVEIHSSTSEGCTGFVGVRWSETGLERFERRLSERATMAHELPSTVLDGCPAIVCDKCLTGGPHDENLRYGPTTAIEKHAQDMGG